jgi:hypothetical protein
MMRVFLNEARFYQDSVVQFPVLSRYFLLFPAVIARCSSLLFTRRDCQKPRDSATFAGSAAVFPWKNSENSGGSRWRRFCPRLAATTPGGPSWALR